MAATYAMHRLTKPGSFRLAIAGHHTGTAPRLVQVGGSRLRPEQHRLLGQPANDEIAAINCAYKGQLYAITLAKLKSSSGAKIRITIRNGTPAAAFTNMTATQKTIRWPGKTQ
jgi:hypothetical protein